MGSVGKQLDKHTIVVAAIAVAGTTCASSCSLEEVSRATLIPSPCPGDVSMDACCTSAFSEQDLLISGNPEVHLSISDASLKNSSVWQGRAAVCAMTALPTPGDYTCPMENSSVHALMPVSAATLIAWPPSMYNQDFTPSGSNLMHVMPPSTSNLSPMMRALEPSKRVFLQRYMSNLLPALKRIHSQGSSISLTEKVSAVKAAADMSLAISAGVGNTWSQALIQHLAGTSTSSNAPLRGSCRKECARKSSMFRGRYHARGGSTLSSCHRRGGSHASALRVDSRTANVAGGCNSMFKVSSNACYYSSVRGCLCANLPECASSACFPRGSSHANCFKDVQPWKLSVSRSCAAGQTSQLPARCLGSKVKRRRQSGVSLYMKILRNSRLVGGVRTSTAAHNECGRPSSSSISKEHIESLGELVPGGRNMDVPVLLQEAAGYILSLQMQVEALESLSHLVSL